MELRVVDHPLAAARLTWSETSSKSARPAKDFESCETVSIAESAECSLVRCTAQLVNYESTRMNTNHKSICLRRGSIAPLACWRCLPAVAHFVPITCLVVTDYEARPVRSFLRFDDIRLC
jgi:hypothetical protein